MVYTTVFTASAKKNMLVHIVDEDVRSCEALSLLLRLEGYETTFSVSSEEALAAMARRRPSMAIVGISQEHGQSLLLLSRLKEEVAGMPVLLIVQTLSVDGVVYAMRQGAVDVLTKPVAEERLLSVVSSILRKDVRVGAFQDGARPVEIGGFNHLTTRERQVLQNIVNGMSNKVAGKALDISPRTVEVHRARVMQKLGAKNTADLLRIVLTS